MFGLNTQSDSPQQLSSPIVWGFNQWSLSDPTLGVSGDTVSFNTLGTALESVPDSTELSKVFMFSFTAGPPGGFYESFASTQSNASFTLTNPIQYVDINTFTLLSEECVAHGTEIEMENQSNSKIESLRARSVLRSIDGSVQLVELVKAGYKKEFIQLQSREIGKPPLLITENHPILIDGKEILPEALLGNSSFAGKLETSRRVALYTLITAQPTFVKANGFWIKTWGEEAWHHRQTHSNSSY